jgi:hypothetical protein
MNEAMTETCGPATSPGDAQAHAKQTTRQRPALLRVPVLSDYLGDLPPDRALTRRDEFALAPVSSLTPAARVALAVAGLGYEYMGAPDASVAVGVWEEGGKLRVLTYPGAVSVTWHVVIGRE